MSSCRPGGSWRARNPGPCSGRPPCPSPMPGGFGCGCTRCTAIRASRRSCWGSSTKTRARAARGMSRNSRSTPACAMSTGWIRPRCSPTAGAGCWIPTTHPSSRASSPRTRCASPDSRSAAELSSPPASSTARSACCQRRPGSGSYRRNARRTYWYGSASWARSTAMAARPRCRRSCARGKTGSGPRWSRSVSPSTGCSSGGRRARRRRPRPRPPRSGPCATSSGRHHTGSRGPRSARSRSTSSTPRSGRCGLI